ncbi:hypothetical protein Z517_05068 [Fonsecaea pedrosoi CBS 271.37]|uniref:Peptidase C1A papain C-terminal domain-containing protein n=1 Tax=Fonsecaea pedrosoi CBS 271.37 TaxID=1442368 RepID=A0A0D2DW86_9EURO|nr:uncharacterized protein Z517_05068 [Fonsecaea pedrosoi CBS 271.37]KIW82041.1 hypothetical protein Z517_05068 [Fonsecaea pedrosoi CBS 271.37]
MEVPQGLFGERGWIAEYYDERDFCYEPAPGIEADPQANLRDSDKYRAYWGKIYNQGSALNSCVANAAAALFTYELNKELAMSKRQTPPAIDPSRSFIWYNARKVEKPAKFDNATCHTRSAMKALQKDGVCKETLCPYPQNPDKTDAVEITSKEPSEDAKSAAKAYQIAWYGRLDKKRSPKERHALEELANRSADEATKEKNRDGELLKEKLCKAITEGYPVLFGIHYYSKDAYKQFEKRESGKWLLTRLDERHKTPPHKYPSHAVLAIGYDEEGVTCQSSYGEDYLDNGTFLAPWAWITDFEATEDFWTMRFF